jgi:hypothetical protein
LRARCSHFAERVTPTFTPWSKSLSARNALITKRGRGPAVTVLLYALVGMQANHYITISEEREENEDFTFGWFMERLSHNIRLYFDKK